MSTETTVTVVFMPPGSFDPGGVVVQPLAPSGEPVGDPVGGGFKKVGPMVVWTGSLPSDGSVACLSFHSTAGWEYRHPVSKSAVNPSANPTESALNQDSAGEGVLSYRDRLGHPVGGASVSVFRPGEHPGGRPVAQAVTARDGRWTTRVAVSPGEYILVFEKPGLFGPDVISVTVPGG